MMPSASPSRLSPTPPPAPSINSRVYIWGWGWIEDNEGVKRSLTPSLLDTMGSSLRRLQTSASVTAALSQEGRLYRWTNTVRPLQRALTADIAQENKVRAVRSVSDEGRYRTERPKEDAKRFDTASQRTPATSPVVHPSARRAFLEIATPLPPGIKIEDTKRRSQFVDVACTLERIYAVSDDGKITIFHRPNPFAPNPPLDSPRPPKRKTPVISVPISPVPEVGKGYAAKWHSVELTGPGSIRYARVAATAEFVVAMSTTGEVYTWGRGRHGALGHGASVERLKSPKCIAGTFKNMVVTRVAAGFGHVCAVTDRGCVWAWGWGTRGQLGVGRCRDSWEPERVKTPKGMHVIDMACGFEHTAAVGAGGKVLTWGGGSRGQLGIGWQPSVATEPQILQNDRMDGLGGQHAIAVACGAFHTAVVTATGEVIVWGWGERGQLGLGGTKSTPSPEIVESMSGMEASVVCCGGSSTFVCTDRYMVIKEDHFTLQTKTQVEAPSNSSMG
ncbi:hypothetical protein AAMO2058_001511800 [Amorphochlora amoebiformis]